MENMAFNFDAPPPILANVHQRILDARSSGKLTDCESDVLSLLAAPEGPRLGRSRAMQISEMQGYWSRTGRHVWPDRTIKGAVKQLLEVHEVPVGSSRAVGCSGYFLLESDEDLQASERPLKGELLSIARRLKALNPRSAFARQLVGQLQIEVEQ
jgi:hypothetical protein